MKPIMENTNGEENSVTSQQILKPRHNCHCSSDGTEKSFDVEKIIVHKDFNKPHEVRDR